MQDDASYLWDGGSKGRSARIRCKRLPRGLPRGRRANTIGFVQRRMRDSSQRRAESFNEGGLSGEVMNLKDKVAIITGAGRGLGRSVALAFGRQGAKIVLAARGREEIDQLVEQMRALRRDVVAIPTDVSDEVQVNRLIEGTLAAYGTVDILVNNAGLRGPIGPICSASLSGWEEVMRANLTSAFLCSRAVLPTMMAK
ncbi:MAG: SDR family NAD(P)-dependent oxidoreductase, partial [Deltaproteobacteria bacterium]|nr:SDR family NAD(P)-dependent oxidoreductase [Deltaproteobacteria bacterium]